MIEFQIGELVLVNTVSLRLKVVNGNLRKKFIGPFPVIKKIDTQSYRLQLPQEWKLHNVFHIHY